MSVCEHKVNQFQLCTLLTTTRTMISSVLKIEEKTMQRKLLELLIIFNNNSERIVMGYVIISGEENST